MTSIHQDEITVQRQFEDQLDLYTVEASAEDYIVPDMVTPFLTPWLHESAAELSDPVRVCEFGGGGGIILKRIHDALDVNAEVVNAELVGGYRDRQVSEVITFRQASILDSGFADGEFDAVLVRNVLHHLITGSLAQTRVNQRHGIAELFRVVRPGGLVLIQEQVNQYRLAAVLLFHLSRTASNLNLNIPAFEVTPNTVVAYLTRTDLLEMCAEFIPAADWLVNDYKRRDVSLRWKLTLLMSNNGDALIGMRKPAEE